MQTLTSRYLSLRVVCNREKWLSIRLFYTGKDSKEQTAKPSFRSSKFNVDKGREVPETADVDAGKLSSAPSERPRSDDVKLSGASSFFWDYAR